MISYIKADIYRIFNKLKMYRYFGILTILFLILMYIQKDSGGERIVAMSDFIFSLVALFGGCYMFNTIYNDDINAKTLPSLIGFGINRITIIISKFILTIVLNLLMFCLFSLVFIIVLIILNTTLSNELLTIIFETAINNYLLVIVYSTIASIFVYGFQKASVSLVIFILLLTSFFTTIFLLITNIQVIKDIIGDVNNLFIDSLVPQIVQEKNITDIIIYIVYVLISIVISTIAFNKKDLEF